MDADLDTLATALYVTCDDLLKSHPDRAPARPGTGFQTRITDAEMVTLAVMQALLQIPKERRFVRHARRHLIGMFPDLPGQSSYNRRPRPRCPPTICGSWTPPPSSAPDHGRP